MKLHRHYRDKPYRVHAIAKHSETLEDFVVYESMYDNPVAKLWMRPRTMFEENVEVEGKSVPRFEKAVLRLETFDRVTDVEETVLSELIAAILGEWDPDWFRSHLRDHAKIHLQIAFVDARAVGFKLGYELDERTFYSWLGGVIPEFRGYGIAADLMTAQHEWCRDRAYRAVRTTSQNRWRGQMILNLKHGFEITGYQASSERGPKIVFEKSLA